MRFRLLCLALPLLLCAQSEPSIEGEVTESATGAPVPNARVKAWRPDGEPLYTKTDERGRFRFGGLDPGPYRVSAQRPGAESSAVNVSVARGAVPVSLALTRFAAISGKVFDANGTPAEAAVAVFAKGPRGLAMLSSVRTNDLGEYRFARLAPGAYYVSAEIRQYAGFTEPADRATWYPDALDAASAAAISLAQGGEVRADIRIVRQPGVRVSGRVSVPAIADGPAGSHTYTNLALVSGREAAWQQRRPFTAASGDRFEFTDVLPGSYRLMALTLNSDGDPWSTGHKPVFYAVQQVQAGQTDVEGLDVQMRPLPDLPGTVTFAPGCRPEPVRIRASGFSVLARFDAESVSGPDGRFVLSAVTPVSLRLLAQADLAAPVSALFGGRDVLNQEFEFPAEGNPVLRISMGCAAGGRAQ